MLTCTPTSTSHLAAAQTGAEKAWRMIRQEQVIERNWECSSLTQKAKSGLQHWLLQPGLRLHEYLFHRPQFRNCCKVFYASPQPDLGYTVSMLLTFSAWLELHA